MILALVLAALGTVASAQISIPTFGTRGGAPDQVLEKVMPALRHLTAEATGLEVSSGDLITPGIAGSLEPEFAMLIAELDNARFAVSGEIARNQASGGEPYAINLIVVDAELGRSTDLISRALDPTDMDGTLRSLAAAIADFVGAAVALPKGSAGLFVSSEPGEADVTVDGVAVGRTSRLDVLMLQPGRHELEVRKEGFLPETRTVELRSDDTSFVHVILTAISGGSIQLSSAPPNARAYLDGVLEGRTPLTLPALPGSHTVRVERDGFQPESFSALVRNYRVTRVDVPLQPATQPLVFWPEKREVSVTIDGRLQTRGFAEGLQPGLRTFLLSQGETSRSYLRAVPASGVFRLDLETGELVPIDVGTHP